MAVERSTWHARAVAWRRQLGDLGFKVMNAGHRTLLRLSGGRLGASSFGMPVVQLHTIGRRSGQRRTTMLTAPVHDDDRVVLVASRGGSDRHPDWYLNLSAHPEVEVTIHGATRRMRARTATPEEKAELWSQITARYQGYGRYQQRTSRDIPVVICEAVADGEPPGAAAEPETEPAAQPGAAPGTEPVGQPAAAVSDEPAAAAAAGAEAGPGEPAGESPGESTEPAPDASPGDPAGESPGESTTPGPARPDEPPAAPGPAAGR